jgi:hypothetical protein
MLDHALETAFAAFLQTDPVFTGIHFFTGHDDEEHALPSVTVSSKSEPLAGSASVFRADLTILAESEAHDSRPADHAALVEKVRARLASKAAVVSALNAGNHVHLYGYAFTGSNMDVDGVRFRTTLTLKAGYGTP